MVNRADILKNNELPEELENNLLNLLEKINRLEEFLKVKFVITSGFRTMKDHLRIYKEIGTNEYNKIPMKSAHLKCLAVDIADPDFSITKLVKLNQEFCEKLGLYFEDDRTKKRLHVQIIPPASKKTWFKP